MEINQHIIDIALFERIAEHDEVAFRELFHNYLPEIRPVILAITKQESVITDIVQEVFLRIWLHRDKLTEIKSPRAWIFKIVYFQSFNWLRQQATRAKHLALAIDSNTNNQEATPHLAFMETSRLVKKAIDHLPPQARKVYQLSREEGMKIAEIAAALNLAPQTVKNTLGRALISIRTFLENNGVIISTILIWYWLA